MTRLRSANRHLLFWGAATTAVVVAALVVFAVSRVGDDDDRTAARPGAVQQASVTATSARHYVDLPAGRLDVEVSGSLDSQPGALDGADLAPPDGGHFTLVRWSPGASETHLVATRPVTARPVTITLISGGRRYPLPVDDLDRGASRVLGVRPALPSGSAYVAVAGGTGRTLEIGYDGVVQRIDAGTGTRTVGRAAPLYSAAPGPHDCGRPRLPAGLTTGPDDSDRIECSYQAYRTAYVDGLGWAQSGRAWLVFDIDAPTPFQLERRTSSGPESIFFSDELTRVVGVRYGGQPMRAAGLDGPAPTGTESDLDAATPAWVASVPARSTGSTPLTFAFALSGTTDAFRDDPSAHVAVQITWTVAVA